ncbi:MAG TPA: hypothetical protein VIJ39_08990 [Solirubrobacteraceae bacterium]
MNVRRLIMMLVGSSLLCGFSFAGGVAQAAVIHNYLSQESPEAYKPTNEVGQVAVDESTSLTDWARGDTYEVIPSENVVDVFEPEAGGKRKLVAQLKGNSPSEPFEFVINVAVDSANGYVIVGSRTGAQQSISLFEPTLQGEYNFVGKLATFEPGNEFLATLFAVNQSNGEIYGAEAHRGQFDKAVSEYSSTGVYLGRILGFDTPGKDLRAIYSVTVDPTSQDIYVLDQREFGEQPVVDIFGPDVTVPDVITGPVTEATPRSATLTGTVNPDNLGVASCQFVWGETVAFGQTAPCSAPISNGESPVQVQAQLTGLAADTTYCYRLQATNAKGTNPGEALQNQCFTTPGPALLSESVSNVTAESATLDATITPHGVPTTYYFQYGTTENYSASIPLQPGEAIGSGADAVEVSQHLQKLPAGTTYHYRVVAVSELAGEQEEFDGQDKTFITQPQGQVSALLDGRQWEMVSPPHKNGALFLGAAGFSGGGFPVKAAANGDAFVDLASQPTEDSAEGNSGSVDVLMTRGSEGWTSQVIAPAHAQGTLQTDGSEYSTFSEDLSHALLLPFGLFTALSPEASEATPYLRTDYVGGDVNARCATGCYQPLVTKNNTAAGVEFGESKVCIAVICGPAFVAATPDLSHVLIASNVQLTSEQAPHGGAYEWSNGVLRLVSGEQPVAGGKQALFNASEQRFGMQAISSDGERVILGGAGTGGIYLHEMSTGVNTRLDELEGGAGPSVLPQFAGASSDASKIFFIDGGRLTATSSASGADLYEYDMDRPAGERLTDLSVDANSGEAANVQAVFGESKDDSYVYFVAAGVLAPGASPGENIYVRHDGVTSLVADGWNGHVEFTRVSSNGLWLSFTSSNDLTGYDTRDVITGRPDQEVYLYDALGKRLICASCDPTGARPVGAPQPESNEVAAASVPAWPRDYQEFVLPYQLRYLSDSGRLFFNSYDALVPQDVDGTEDVYEFEPRGGRCTAAVSTYVEAMDGCLGLISSGASSEGSSFVDASESGGDVFFRTAAKLLSQDFDSAMDIYDARECSVALPCFPAAPVSPPICATGDACKPAPTPQPGLFGSAPSATFSGVGNVSATVPVPAVKPKSLTRAQKLSRALKSCRVKRSRRRRRSCEAAARKRYGSRAGKANSKKKGGR